MPYTAPSLSRKDRSHYFNKPKQRSNPSASRVIESKINACATTNIPQCFTSNNTTWAKEGKRLDYSYLLRTPLYIQQQLNLICTRGFNYVDPLLPYHFIIDHILINTKCVIPFFNTSFQVLYSTLILYQSLLMCQHLTIAFKACF